ncbi:alpha/beta hydrolase domain-containing protein [Nocardioides sp. W7]|uniref:alpha/beta hydrolase domain-containing protein n=1 Tax=Nocardioides sp. W7 TaxID=2931390 RepID=UPI001FD320DC|nr:alpha/beta hydrolase domain-containing protein [Nocardioides sp. W7]
MNRALALILLLLALPACSSDPGEPSSEERSGPGRISGGDGPFLAGAKDIPLPAGWTEDELLLEGTATSYSGTRSADGRFDLTPARSLGYRTRVLTRMPPAKEFNGTVLVEWLNVSGGFDAAPDWTYLADEILRGGYAWVGVSAQHVGVEGGRVAVSTPVSEAAGAGKGLRALDPERYDDLHHPGDEYSYDIYTQAAAAVRGGDLLGTLEPERVLAIGESQSGFALTTYANGVQPLSDAFDGFLVHSRGGASAPLSGTGGAIDIASTLSGEPTLIRDDLDVPVLTLETETDVVGVLNYLPARQPDSATFRLWEVAGTAHADAYSLGPVADTLGCPLPINDGPHHLVAKAALRALDGWVRDGTAPPTADRLTVRDGTYVRDRDGIVRGGIRTPLVDVPVDVLSGDPAPDGPLTCLLFGTTTPLPAGRLAERHADRTSYLTAFEDSADAVVAAGFVLPEDREALLATAQPERLGG